MTGDTKEGHADEKNTAEGTQRKPLAQDVRPTPAVPDVLVNTEALDVWKAMLRRHDLTYNMSDDSGQWQNGYSEWKALVGYAARKHFPPALCSTEWNAMVDRKMARAQETFYTTDAEWTEWLVTFKNA